MPDLKISQLDAGDPIQAGDFIPIARSGNNFAILGSNMWNLNSGVMSPVVVGSGIELVDDTTGGTVAFTCNNSGIDYFTLATTVIGGVLSLQGNISGFGGSVVLSGGAEGSGSDDGNLYCNGSNVVKWTHVAGADATLFIQDNGTTLEMNATNAGNTATLSLSSDAGIVNLATSNGQFSFVGNGAANQSIEVSYDNGYVNYCGGTGLATCAYVTVSGSSAPLSAIGILGSENAAVIEWSSIPTPNSYLTVLNGTNSGLAAPSIYATSTQADCDFVLGARGAGTVIIDGNFLVNDNVTFSNLPTSAAGLTSGMLWNNGGVINIVP